MEKTFVKVIGTRGIISLRMSNIHGGTSLVTVVLDEILSKHQFAIVDGTVRRVECYRGLIRDRHQRKLIGARSFDVHAYEETVRFPGGETIKGWVLTAQ